MQVDSLLLANSAELRDGLLFVLGGGWTRCWPEPGQQFPFQRVIVSALAIRVDYAETNEEHRFRLEVRDADETVLQPQQIDGGFTVGRPPDLAAGMSQVVQMAGPMAVEIPAPGVFSLVLAIDGSEARRIAFEVMPASPALP